MGAEIGRQIADAQAAIRVGSIGMAWDDCEPLGVPVAPALKFGINQDGIVPGTIMQRQDEVAVPRGGNVLEADSPAVGGEGLIELASLFINDAKADMSLRQVRLKRACALTGGESFIELAALLKDDAQGAMGIG